MKEIYYLPIKYSLAFLVITELLIWVGPVNYEITNPLMLISYLIIVNVALYLGFNKGIKKAKVSSFSMTLQTVNLLILIGFFVNIYTMRIKWATHGRSVTFENLVSALLDPGNAYYREGEIAINTQAAFIYVIIGPLQWAAIPLGIYYWKKLSRFFRFIVVGTCIITVMTWLGIGTRKGLFDLIITIAFLFVSKNPEKIINNQTKRRIKLYALLFIIAFLFFFVFSNLSRGGRSLSDISDISLNSINPWYRKHLPIGLLVALTQITNYLCGGYRLLSLGLREGIITPTIMGVGYGTANYSIRLFGYNPIPYTYMQLIQDKFGFDKYQCWHTIYLWLANDFTFVFVPVVIFIIGYYFARVWADCIYGKNPLAYPVLAYMIVMVFYFFANNQVISFSLESFVGCVFVYEVSRFSRNIV